MLKGLCHKQYVCRYRLVCSRYKSVHGVLNLQLCTRWGPTQLQMTVHCYALTLGLSVLWHCYAASFHVLLLAYKAVRNVQALALGADAVLLGRPVMFGLALDGQKGVERVLEVLRRELELAMVLAGCSSLSDISKDLLMQYPASML